MNDNLEPKLKDTSGPIAFQTEIKQLLNILVHSLYTKKEMEKILILQRNLSRVPPFK